MLLKVLTILYHAVCCIVVFLVICILLAIWY